jgi:hypothetical protein
VENDELHDGFAVHPPNVAILFQITQAELKSFLANMGNTSALSGTGIVMGGIKYM